MPDYIHDVFGDAMRKGADGKAREAENGSAYTTMWFDPGETTGWAVFVVHPDCLEPPELVGEDYRILDNIIFWSAGQFVGEENAVVDQMVALAEAWPDDTVLGCEDFILRSPRKDRTLLSPVRITAKFEYAVCCSPGWRPLHLQQPGMAMSAVTDDRLKMWGFYNRLVGQQHARDAVRHAILWLRMEKQRRVDAYNVLMRQKQKEGGAT